MDNQQYKAFLEEMNAMENFRMAYLADHPSIPLERDDPDVRRLIEAMAFFSARTHLAATRNIFATRLRWFQQFFPFLLSPMPAMGLVQIIPTGQFVESITLPMGSEMAISSESGGTATLRTLADLTIIPLSRHGSSMVDLPGGGYRWMMHLRTPYTRSDDIGRLSFHINHLFDYLASLRLLHALKHHLKRTAVVFDEKAGETSVGTPCKVTFGLFEDKKTTTNWPHPIQKERLFFHFPTRDLFMNVSIPSTPRNWRSFTLMMDLDAHWPKNLRLKPDMFELFTVPIENLKHEMAQPVIFDGTRERVSIRHADPGKGFELHAILGVYQVEKDTLIPMKPGILSTEGGAYEIGISGQSDNRRYWLNVHFPRAFQQPRTICVDAEWHQPWFSQAMPQRMKIMPFTRNVPGLKWEILGEFVPYTDAKIHENIDLFLHLLVLTSKFMLNTDDLKSLLAATGVFEKGQFKNAQEFLKDVRVEEAPLQEPRKGHLLKHVYYLKMNEFDEGIQPLVETFVEHLEAMLNAWISNNVVEVKLESGGL